MATTLSDLLEAIRLRRTNWIVVEVGPHEQVKLPSSQDALLYLVTAGKGVLRWPEGALALEVGSAAFVLNRKPHDFSAGEKHSVVRQLAFPGGQRPDRPPVLAGGGGQRPTTRLVIGQLQIDPGPGNPILSMVPDIVPLTIETLGSVAFNSMMITEIVNRPGAMAYLARLAEIFLIRALQTSTYRNIEEHRALSDALGSARILRAINSITENPGAPWSVPRLAKEAGMSRSSFAAEFVRIVGQSPMRLVAEKRLEAAANALSRGTIPVATVARCVGYKSDASFSRQFKQVFGVSPGVYGRRMNTRA